MSSVAKHILSALDGTALTDLERDLILKHKILGFTLFSRNVEDARQLIALNQEIHALAKQAGYKIIIAVDQEGGRVARLPEPFNKIPPMRDWGQRFDQDAQAETLFELGKLIAQEVKLAGFNLDFTPVVDLDINPDSPVIGDRSFSNNPEVVYKCARQLTRGVLHQGIIPCLKHFPGHGATTQDSHFELPTDNRTLDELIAKDLVPYKKLILDNLAPSIITAHVLYPNIDDKNPATLSPKILTGILRDQLKYNGVVFSDDLFMKAIADHYGFTQACKEFFLSGGDVALMCREPQKTVELIEDFESHCLDEHMTQVLNTSQKRIQDLLSLCGETQEQSFNDILEVLKKNRDFL